MRIAIDCRPLMAGKTTGVETYMHNLLHALFKSDPKNDYILWYNGAKEINTAHFPKGYANVTLKRTRIPNKLLNLSLSLLRWPKIDKLIGGSIDLLWVPDPRPAPVSITCRKVITFHDLSFEQFKYAFSLKSRLWHRLLRPKKEAREAHHLIAVSHFTKEQLKEVYGIADPKITVIHEAAADYLNAHKIPKLFQVIERNYGVTKPYFLLLSTIEPRKNIARALQAFREWQEAGNADISLVVAGEKYPSIFHTVPLARYHPKIIFTGFIHESDKATLYQNALAFLYPSLYEGFGLPALEAMQCGTPVITSDVTALPEVAGDAAIKVNPSSLVAIKKAMHEMYSDDRLRKELKTKGLERATRFSWQKAAAETLVVLLREALK